MDARKFREVDEKVLGRVLELLASEKYRHRAPVTAEGWACETSRTIDKDFKWRSATAGSAGYRKIRMNMTLLDTAEKYEETLRHEWAHILAAWIYPRAKRSHGPEWRELALAMGDDGKRCHNYDVVAAFPDKFITYDCPGCKAHHVITKRKARLMEKSRYLCRCKTPIVMVGLEPAKPRKDPWDCVYELAAKLGAEVIGSRPGRGESYGELEIEAPKGKLWKATETHNLLAGWGYGATMRGARALLLSDLGCGLEDCDPASCSSDCFEEVAKAA